MFHSPPSLRYRPSPVDLPTLSYSGVYFSQNSGSKARGSYTLLHFGPDILTWLNSLICTLVCILNAQAKPHPRRAWISYWLSKVQPEAPWGPGVQGSLAYHVLIVLCGQAKFFLHVIYTLVWSGRVLLEARLANFAQVPLHCALPDHPSYYIQLPFITQTGA